MVLHAAQGGSDHVQVVCALSGQLLATATLATPSSWAQAQRSLHPAHGAPTPLAKSGMSAAPLAEYIYLQYKVTI